MKVEVTLVLDVDDAQRVTDAVRHDVHSSVRAQALRSDVVRGVTLLRAEAGHSPSTRRGPGPERGCEPGGNGRRSG